MCRITLVSPSVSGTVRFEAAERRDGGVYVCTVTTLYNSIMGPPVQSTPTNLTIIGTNDILTENSFINCKPARAQYKLYTYVVRMPKVNVFT